MSGRRLPRRTFLRGAGGVAIALPFLEIMQPKTSRAAPAPGMGKNGRPLRFVAMFTPCGTIAESWRPTGSPTQFALSPILAPLERHKSDLLILQGLNQKSDSRGDGHQDGTAGFLTGDGLNPGEFRGGAGSAGWAKNISVDQHIAQAIGNNTAFRSLEFGVQVRDATNWHRISYLGSDRPVPPESDPQRAFERIFGDIAASDPEAAARRRFSKQAILDTVMDDFNSLNPLLGAADKLKLDQHLTAVREMEQRLKVVPPSASACTAPNVGAPLNLFLNDNYPEIGRLQLDLLAMALSCELTHVASILWSRSASRTRFTWLDIHEEHHELSHEGDDNADAKDKLTRINHWYAEQLAALIDRLKAASDGPDGSVFDNTIMLWGNELGKGNSHSRDDAPYVLAGDAGGYFQTGRYLQYAGEPHNNLLLSLVNSCGIEQPSFGNPEWCTGPLAGLA